MQIDDDGGGIDSARPSSDGMGLRIMRYRARMIGAAIEIKEKESGGTEVLCRYNPDDDHATRRDRHGSS
jgi:nitrate/nitrite-specific signal transduction histidine kinase